MAQIRRMQQMRHVDCYRRCIAYVMRNVFSRARKTDSDMSSRSAAGRLFHTVGP